MSFANCWMADFETTTDVNDCRVWAFSLCNIDQPDIFTYGTSIEEFFEWILLHDKENLKIWFHNLKFDGFFILNYLYSHGYVWVESSKFKKDNTFTTLISDMGEYYKIEVYFSVHGHHTSKVTFFDSAKVFPNLSVEGIAEGFHLPIRKLEIDYKEYRDPDHVLTQQEIDYIRNDVEIVARALNHMFNQGQTKMTIASCAMNDYKHRIVGFRRKFPLLLDEVDAEIRKSYRGGFTYVNDTWKEKLIGKGIVLDVNSLYPSCMLLPLPHGHPVYFEGKYEEDFIYPLYTQTLICSFNLKPNKIPSIQLKNNLSFRANEYLKSSNNEYVQLTLTSVDLKLFFEQYDVDVKDYVGGWKFRQAIGLFDDYINHWMEEKVKAGKEGNYPQKMLSKTMLNSLYGKYGSSSNSMTKMPYLDSDGVVKFLMKEGKKRQTCYIPVACFVTSYGRNKTIRTSQAIKDYTLKKYGEDRYYYSDTDSIHATLSDEDLEELKEIIQIDDFKLGYWAKEAEFTRAMYIRQKCYIEEVNGKTMVTVAGLPKYMRPIVTFENFKRGFTTAGLSLEDLQKMAIENGADKEEIRKLHHKLTYKYVHGGVILADTDFTIK